MLSCAKSSRQRGWLRAMHAAKNERSTVKKALAHASNIRRDSCLRMLWLKADLLNADGCFRCSILPVLRYGTGKTIRRESSDADQLRRLIGKYYYEGVARSGCSLRASNEALESQDEGIHLRRAQWDLHYRSAKDPQDVQRGVEVCTGSRRPGENRSLCGHQTAGARRHSRRSAEVRRVLH